MLDKIGRRPRDLPVSTGKWVSPYRDRRQRNPKEHVFTWFEMVHRHGDLPAPYLLEFTKGLITEKAAYALLTDLFHEDQTPYGGMLLARPKYQFATFRKLNTRVPVTEHLVYAKNANTLEALKRENRYHEHVPEPSNSPRHDFNRSCFTASIHLATVKAPHRYEYIFHDAIVDLIKTDRFTLSDGAVLKPDCLFAIRYLPTEQWIVFVVEVDREGSRQKWKRKLELYQKLIGGGAYKKVFWEGARLMHMSVFDSPGKMQNVMQDALKLSGGAGCNYMLFKSVPYYAGHFVPPPVMPELFYEPWLRAGLDPFSLSDPPGR